MGIAQGVGLSGNRISVFYDFDYSGSLYPRVFLAEDNIEYYNILNDKKPLKLKAIINIRHTLRVDYALLRNVSVGVFASYHRDGYGVVSPLLFSKNYTVFTYGILFKDFFLERGGIAPLGNYIGIKLAINNVNAHNRGNPTIYGEDYREHEFSFFIPMVGFSLGRQGVLANTLLYNVSFEIGVNIDNLGNFEDPWATVSPQNSFFDNKPDILQKLWGNNLFRLTFGVGIAPL